MIKKILVLFVLVAVVVSARESVYLSMNGESVGTSVNLKLNEGKLYEFVGTGSSNIKRVSMYIKDTSMSDSDDADGESDPKVKISFTPTADATYELDIIGYVHDGTGYKREESQKFYLVVGSGGDTPEDDPETEDTSDDTADEEHHGLLFYQEYVHHTTGRSVLIAENALTQDFLKCFGKGRLYVEKSNLVEKNREWGYPVYDKSNPPPKCEADCTTLTDFAGQCQEYYSCRTTGSAWFQTKMDNKIKLGFVDTDQPKVTDVFMGGQPDDVVLVYNFKDSKYYFFGPPKGTEKTQYYKEDIKSIIDDYYQEHGIVPCYVFRKIEEEVTVPTDNLPQCKTQFKIALDIQKDKPKDIEAALDAYETVADSCVNNIYGALAMLNSAQILFDWDLNEDADDIAVLALNTYGEVFPVLKADMLYLILQIKEQRGLCSEFYVYFDQYNELEPGRADNLKKSCDARILVDANLVKLHYSGSTESKLDILLLPDEFIDKSSAIIEMEKVKNAILTDPTYSKYSDLYNIYGVDKADLDICDASSSYFCSTPKTENMRKIYCPYCDTAIVVSQVSFRPYAQLTPSSEPSWNFNTAYLSLSYIEKSRQYLRSMGISVDLLQRVAVHEIGHAVYALEDEYIEAGSVDLPGPPNCAASIDQASNWWADLLDSAEIGKYKGCSFTTDNIRPTENSIMNNHWAKDYPGFGPVNENRIKEIMEGYS